MAIVLAAGASRRFGRRDKLLARLGARSLLGHALDRARAALPVGRVLLVVPAPHGAVARMARGEPRLRLVVARGHRRGMAASLAAGLAATRPIERELLIFLGDMPGALLPRGMRLTPALDAIRPLARGVPGHPLLVRRAAARAALPQAGDRGLVAGLDRARVGQVRARGDHQRDIDTPAALARARRHRGKDAR